MSVEEQALKLYKQYDELVKDHTRGVTVKPLAKECTLIAVNEIMNFMKNDDEESDTCYWANHPTMTYWIQVKQEIEKL